MNGLTDQELLRDYAKRRAEPAFGELVQRHVDFVYSVALRLVRDTHLAEDVTQAVFMALARSAPQLTERPVLSGWLHRTTRNLASNTVRSGVRRRAREQEAATMNDLLAGEPDATWEELAPHLDEALSALNETDRDALLLRYFERKTAREMAQMLGTSEESAQKRVSRAVERLREVLTKRGVTASASGLTVLMSAQAVQAAPMGLALSITGSAALGGTAAGGLAGSTATKVIAMTTLQKTLAITTVVAAIGVATYQTRQAAILRGQVKSMEERLAIGPERAVAELESLMTKVRGLEIQNAELAEAVAQANSEKARLQTEREQARHSAAALYEELARQSTSKDGDLTNAYPSARYVWAAFGRLGRLSALAKQDDSKLSPEEKTALEAARSKALEDLPTLVKAAKYYDAREEAGTKAEPEEQLDRMACLLYGALNLDEQQFGQVYGLMENFQEEAKQRGLRGGSETNSRPEKAAALMELMEQFKGEIQPLLSAEQVGIFAEVLTHMKLEPGNFTFNFNF